jgi:hypothetical protein
MWSESQEAGRHFAAPSHSPLVIEPDHRKHVLSLETEVTFESRPEEKLLE